MCSRMAVARGRVPWKLLPRVLNIVAFALFHSCQIFASLCIQGASNLDALYRLLLVSISTSLHVR